MALVGGATRMPSVQAFISRLTGLPLEVCPFPASNLSCVISHEMRHGGGSLTASGSAAWLSGCAWLAGLKL